MARKAWAWANLSIDLVGGILGQLIEDVRSQLAAHQESADWYQAEIEKAQAGRDWHLQKAQVVKERLQRLEELQASATAIADADSDTEE